MTSLHADEAFLDHYQFTHDPFAARVPGFKFFPAQRKPVLGQLHHLARYSQLLLVVTGPEGSGKTLLRQALVASTNKQAVHNVVVSAQGAADPATLLRHVAQGLNAQQTDTAALLAQVGQLALTGQEVYLLVDDAEELSDAALEALLALAEGNGDGRAHVFLFADSELIERLDAMADGAEAFHVIELQPYEEDETRDYLAQRLEGAAQGLEVFSDEQIESIHERSGGWPGEINRVAREVLIDAMASRRGAAKRSGFAFSLPKKHLLALAVVGIGVVAAWLMQGRSDPADVAQPVAQVPLGQTAQPSAPAAPAGNAQEPAPAIEFAGSNQPLPLPLVGQSQPVIRQPLAQAATGEVDGDGEAEVAEPIANAPPPVVLPPAAPEPAPVVTPPPAQAPAAQPPKPVAQAPKPAAPAPAPPAQAASGSAWYSTQTASHYTLQILGTSSESSAQAFVRANGGQYRYFKKQHQGKPLFVVTYGSFASRDAAQAALKALPAQVQAGKPWPRTFASVTQEITP
ncbi:SPOR domain-containing protein [Phytopseudomonas dryadis]|uniref:Cell division protein n=1 Tax=Phytopseudomonas dryadis TaxID=2487520 RepID=A0A4V2KD05_9GAMM|nr:MULTISPECIES: AAA family ATPase [Pseudomonas]TBU97042.1 cell division protein [Pseudomonas dryadis]TBV08620.1 cell division protein [Pseudomonas dryadis]TBV18988.1 cell division protein [Pseudomonas sp. FRB 230]